MPEADPAARIMMQVQLVSIFALFAWAARAVSQPSLWNQRQIHGKSARLTCLCVIATHHRSVESQGSASFHAFSGRPEEAV